MGLLAVHSAPCAMCNVCLHLYICPIFDILHMISISSVSAQSRWGVPWYMCVARVSILSLAPYCCTLARGRGGEARAVGTTNGKKDKNTHLEKVQ